MTPSFPAFRLTRARLASLLPAIAAGALLLASAGGAIADEINPEAAIEQAPSHPSTLPGAIFQTADGRGRIKFELCEDGRLCGALHWFRNAEIDPETPYIDHSNPNPDLRGRPLQGIRLLWGFEWRNGAWRDGAIYRPKNGRTYRANITELEDGRIEVQGCLLIFCRGQIWTPYQDPDETS